MANTSGSRFGWSYVVNASDCPTKWYLRNLAPWPGSGVIVDAVSKRLRLDGLQSTLPADGLRTKLPDGVDSSSGLPIGIESKRFAPALDIGTRAHAGLEAWYRSGLRDGGDSRERSLDRAIEAVRADAPADPTEPESEAIATAERLMRNYIGHYGQDSDIEVLVFPDGTPGIEVELWLDLGYGGYQFTSRLDMIYRRNGYVFALEHKTTAASAFGKLLTRFTIDGQVTGQFVQLISHLPNENIGGVTLNALVKDRAAKSTLPSFSRRDYSRTPAQVEKFRLDIVRKLKMIDGWVEEWLELVAKGMAFEDAALAVFDGTPNGTQCVGMGFSCEFLELCQSREVAGRLQWDNYQPRVYVEDYSNPLRLRDGLRDNPRDEKILAKPLDDPATEA